MSNEFRIEWKNLFVLVCESSTSPPKGQLTISYNNADEFEGILQRLNIED